MEVEVGVEREREREGEREGERERVTARTRERESRRRLVDSLDGVWDEAVAQAARAAETYPWLQPTTRPTSVVEKKEKEK